MATLGLNIATLESRPIQESLWRSSTSEGHCSWLEASDVLWLAWSGGEVVSASIDAQGRAALQLPTPEALSLDGGAPLIEWVALAKPQGRVPLELELQEWPLALRQLEQRRDEATLAALQSRYQLWLLNEEIVATQLSELMTPIALLHEDNISALERCIDRAFTRGQTLERDRLRGALEEEQIQLEAVMEPLLLAHEEHGQAHFFHLPEGFQSQQQLAAISLSLAESLRTLDDLEDLVEQAQSGYNTCDESAIGQLCYRLGQELEIASRQNSDLDAGILAELSACPELTLTCLPELSQSVAELDLTSQERYLSQVYSAVPASYVLFQLKNPRTEAEQALWLRELLAWPRGSLRARVFDSAFEHKDL